MTATGSAIAIRHWSWRLGRLISSQRFLPLVLTAGLGWLVFAGFRGTLLLTNLPLVKGIGGRVILRCFAVGMLYDSVAIGYTLLPMVLALMLAGDGAFARRGFRRSVTAYAAALLTLAIVVESIGLAFFLHFGLRLNWMAVDYLKDWQEVGTYIWNNYPAWLLLVGPVAGYYLFFRILRWAFWRGRSPSGPAWCRLILAGLLTGLCVLACRGGVDHHPLQLGRAYFSDNEVISQVSLNNAYTLFHATRSWLRDSEGAINQYPSPPADEAGKLAASLLTQPQDTPLPSEKNPLLRRTRTGSRRNPYNVVVILMEGMAGRPVGALGNSPSQTPCFDALCRAGLFFERVYAVGERTSHGVVGVLCGYPDLGGSSLLNRSRSQGNFLTLPGLLRKRGYRTLFVYGGNPDFDNMQGFLGANGAIETFIGQEQLQQQERPGNWGVSDEVIFRKAHQVLQEMGEQKFFAFILTVSNHEPYDVPPGRVELLPPSSEQNRRLNGYRYADWALGEFFKVARQSPYFDRTVFVLVSDHGRGLDRSRILDAPGHRVPLLIYAPRIVPAGRVSTVGSQTDVPATVLALLGGTFDHCFMGRNLLAVKEDDGFALLDAGDRLGFVKGDSALVLSPRRSPRLFRLDASNMAPAPPGPTTRRQIEQLQLEMLSYYRTAWELYMARAYNLSGRSPPEEDEEP